MDDHASFLYQMFLMCMFLQEEDFAGLRVTKCNKATVLLTLTLFQTETLTLTVILTP